MIPAGDLDKRITVEAATVTRNTSTGAEVLSWATLGSAMWAQVIESATATDEGLSGDVSTYARPTRIRVRYRSDITPELRVNLGSSRYLQIIGVAVLGRNEAIELACKEWAHE